MRWASFAAVILIPKIKPEIVVPDALLGRAVEAILGTAASGKIGDGKVSVLDVAAAYRIRTRETGEAAL